MQQKLAFEFDNLVILFETGMVNEAEEIEAAFMAELKLQKNWCKAEFLKGMTRIGPRWQCLGRVTADHKKLCGLDHACTWLSKCYNLGRWIGFILNLNNRFEFKFKLIQIS